MKKTGTLVSVLLGVALLYTVNHYLIPISYFSPKVFSLLKPFLLPKGYFNYKACQDLQTFLKGKTVAIVGPAASFEGSHYGPEIDGHDVVVRVNSGVFDDEAFKNDFGSRTDVIISNFSIPNLNVLYHFREGWKTSRFFVAVLNFSGDILDHLNSSSQVLPPPNLRILSTVLENKMEFCALQDIFFNPLQNRFRIRFTTGMGTISFLLTSRLKQLSIFGFDFYSSGYHKWLESWISKNSKPQTLKDLKKALITAGLSHDQQAHFKYFEEYVLTDKRTRWNKPRKNNQPEKND